MFSRLKDAITKTNEEQPEASKKKVVDISFLSTKEIEDYKKALGEIGKHIEEIADIAIDNKQSILAFIKDQQENKAKQEKGKEEEDEVFTLPEDLEEIKSLMKDAISKLSKIQMMNEEIKDRAKGITSGEPP